LDRAVGVERIPLYGAQDYARSLVSACGVLRSFVRGG
jgi:hypothetical protein